MLVHEYVTLAHIELARNPRRTDHAVENYPVLRMPIFWWLASTTMEVRTMGFGLPLPGSQLCPLVPALQREQNAHFVGIARGMVSPHTHILHSKVTHLWSRGQLVCYSLVSFCSRPWFYWESVDSMPLSLYWQGCRGFASKVVQRVCKICVLIKKHCLGI